MAVVQGRVVRKYDVRYFMYKSGPRVGHEGKLVSVDIVLADGSQARATFFGDAVTRAHDMLKEGLTYALAGGRWQKARVGRGCGL